MRSAAPLRPTTGQGRGRVESGEWRVESGEPALALHRGSYTVKQGCFRQVGPPPPIRRGGSFESETGFVSNKWSIPLQPLFIQSVEPDLRIIRTRGLFQTGPAPALVCGSFEGETSCQFLSNPFSFNLLNRICVIRTRGLFQTSGAPALPCRSYEEETADHF